MINIRPVSDLRNKYTEIEELVLKEDEEVYLTKNGYGTMVLMSIDKYYDIINELEYKKYVEKALDEVDYEASKDEVKYYSHEEVFSTLRRKINE